MSFSLSTNDPFLFSRFCRENRKSPDPFTEEHFVLTDSMPIARAKTSGSLLLLLTNEKSLKDCHTKGDRVRLTGDE